MIQRESKFLKLGPTYANDAVHSRPEFLFQEAATATRRFCYTCQTWDKMMAERPSLLKHGQ